MKNWQKNMDGIMNELKYSTKRMLVDNEEPLPFDDTEMFDLLKTIVDDAIQELQKEQE